MTSININRKLLFSNVFRLWIHDCIVFESGKRKKGKKKGKEREEKVVECALTLVFILDTNPESETLPCLPFLPMMVTRILIVVNRLDPARKTVCRRESIQSKKRGRESNKKSFEKMRKQLKRKSRKRETSVT